MQVYLDMVLLLNGAVNYLLLCATARLRGAVPRRRRLLAAAALGAAYACAAFLPGLALLTGLVWRVGVFLAMLCIAFGVSRSLPAQGAIFLALSLALSGLVLVLGSALRVQVWILDGRAYYALGVGALLLSASAVYLGAWLLLQGAFAHTGGIVRARLELCGRRTELSMLRDTGNTLRDPFTGSPVPVVEGQVFDRLLPAHTSWDDAVSAMEQLSAAIPALSMRLLPYRAVGTERALLLAVRCDRLWLAGKARRNIFVAVSPTAVSEDGSYEGLLGGGETE